MNQNCRVCLWAEQKEYYLKEGNKANWLGKHSFLPDIHRWEQLLENVYFSNEVSYNKIQIVIDAHVYKQWLLINKLGAFFLKLGAKTYFGIEKISFFWNYIGPWLGTVGYYLVQCGTVVYCGGYYGVLWGYYGVLCGPVGVLQGTAWYCWLLLVTFGYWAVLGGTGWYWGEL